MPRSSTLPEILDWLYRPHALDDGTVVDRARLLLLDTIGCFIAAQTKPEPAALARHLVALEPGAVRLPGTSVSLTPSAAAYVFAVGACWDEACEGLARAHGRPGLHAIPPALSVGLAKGGDLGSVLRAVITGYEIGGRLGEALRIRPGMHVDGAWGALGAAAAATRMLGGDAETCVTAVNAAACQIPFSLYAPVASGKTARNMYCGHGATLGLQSAIAALAGFTAPEHALAEHRGRALGGGDQPVDLAPVGEFLLPRGYLKPFAAVRHVHYGAQAALDWRRRHGGATTEISAITLRIYDEAIRYCGNRAPVTAIQAQFSLSHGLAWALRDGDLGPQAYTAQAMADPEVRRLEKLVMLETNPDLSAAETRGADLTITRNGARETHSVETIPGDPGAPMEEPAVREKFARYASPAIGPRNAEKLMDAVLGAPFEAPIAELLAIERGRRASR